MKLTEICRLFATPARQKGIEKALRAKKKRLRLAGLAGSAAMVVLAGMKRGKTPGIIIADDADTAGYAYHDLLQLLGDRAVKFFPSGYKRDIRFGRVDAPAGILRAEALDSWERKETQWIVTYPEAIAERVPLPSRLQAETLGLSRGEKVEMSQVTATLRERGFRETDYVYEPGQFSIRGSLLDVYSYANELPYRIDFFDNEIDSIRTFNVETQLSEERLEYASLIPAIAEGDSKEGISLPEFCGSDALIACGSMDWVLDHVRGVCSQSMADAALLDAEGDLNATDHLVDFASFEESVKSNPLLEYGALPDATKEDAEMRFECSPQALYHKNFDMISESLSDFIKKGYSIYILSDSAAQIERLRTIFADRGDNIPFTAADRTLHQGFIDHEGKNCFLTDHQIFDRFHKYNLKSDRARSGKLALSLKELSRIEAGDYIVHADHGIGRFGGLVRTDANGKPQEMIKLLYENDDIILVSIHSLHKLSKYRGKEGVPPRINKLGTGAWNRLKERTKSKVKDIARDLIALYAARRDQKGFSFSPDSYMQHELEASFIYEDTPDQVKATEAIKKDMESDRPMDRLVCGDVGFGKTELAIRAAFKAAVDGKQSAVLVPTTVLAMQHYHTFTDRLKDLPVRVDLLSRARKPKEVKQVLADLEAGKIDILIGTHKLIGKGVKFKDLGLLVIDEEQKFGVAVKEKLKQMKVNVDTLTMSATPIPRTLQFSLMGARDLSNLNTPPANRRPIETYVSTATDDVIAEAVNFELSRNGQIFWVCNRIEHLAEVEARLKRLVPDVRIAIGHGRLAPDKLEKVILDFAAHDYDILLSTTIIENGIDMPNVNTIIVEGAQNFGLSELHQLRGRVGRSSRKGFCYLLVPSGMPLSPVARRRLQAIEAFSDLGSGIRIAMQDLDIRGAGNLLGAEQSGFIADLGFETYQKILKEAVIELKTDEFADTFAEADSAEEQEFVADCTIESDMELLIPPSYVPQEGERISLYQELDNMETSEQTDEFRSRMLDRFGRIPAVTEELIRIVPLRAAAKRLGIERLNLKGGQMYLYFVGDDNLAYYRSNAFGRVLSYMQANPRRTRLRQNGTRRSIAIEGVESVTQALDILTQITGMEAI